MLDNTIFKSVSEEFSVHDAAYRLNQDLSPT
jgi:hypothetical protein